MWRDIDTTRAGQHDPFDRAFPPMHGVSEVYGGNNAAVQTTLKTKVKVKANVDLYNASS